MREPPKVYTAKSLVDDVHQTHITSVCFVCLAVAVWGGHSVDTEHHKVARESSRPICIQSPDVSVVGCIYIFGVCCGGSECRKNGRLNFRAQSGRRPANFQLRLVALFADGFQSKCN